jgi:hypothetical protein
MKTIKSLSKGMIETLMECHERELLGHAPCLADMASVSGLLLRGLIEPKTIKQGDKELGGFFVTESGKEFLQEYTRGY